MSPFANDPENMRRELGAFTACVQALDNTVATIELRRGDRESLAAAIAHIEKLIDIQLRQLLGREQARSVATDLKETRPRSANGTVSQWFPGA